jgi:hypothetical protein
MDQANFIKRELGIKSFADFLGLPRSRLMKLA